jgi:hypothetical protein
MPKVARQLHVSITSNRISEFVADELVGLGAKVSADNRLLKGTQFTLLTGSVRE